MPQTRLMEAAILSLEGERRQVGAGWLSKQGQPDVLEALRHGKLGEKKLAGAGPAASDRKRIR